MNATRITLLALFTPGVVACADVWNFQEIELVDSSIQSSDTSGGPMDAGREADADARTSTNGQDATEEATGDASGDAADASMSCAPMTLCGAKCLDLTSDNQNCGGCGLACTGAYMNCVASQCVCAPGYHSCPGLGCLSNDSTYSCGSSCTTCPLPAGGQTNTCVNEVCGTCFALAFSRLTTLCNGNTPNAACVDTTADENNCGACGKVCHGRDGGGFGTCVDSGCQ